MERDSQAGETRDMQQEKKSNLDLQTPGSLVTQKKLIVYVTMVLLVLAVTAAYSARWICDDAFISFRYALNFIKGNGLVFNAGEYVEGYTNPLWTLLIAIGLGLDISAEWWAMFWGIVFYCGTILLLVLCHTRQRDSLGIGVLTLPMAAAMAAFHPDWQIYASGGLETSLFTFLITAGYYFLASGKNRTLYWFLSGLFFFLGALTRPDGAMFFGIGGLYLFIFNFPSFRPLLKYATIPLVLGGFFLAWKISYYGDVFPNTYYAKSANLAWYDQGWSYALIYFQKYWILLLSLPLGLFFLLFDAKKRGSFGKWIYKTPYLDIFLPLLLALAYTLYVIRVGGDFMYARFLIPATPFYLLAIDASFLMLIKNRSFVQMSATLVFCGFLLFNPNLNNSRLGN